MFVTKSTSSSNGEISFIVYPHQPVPPDWQQSVSQPENGHHLYSTPPMLNHMFQWNGQTRWAGTSKTSLVLVGIHQTFLGDSHATTHHHQRSLTRFIGVPHDTLLYFGPTTEAIPATFNEQGSRCASDPLTPFTNAYSPPRDKFDYQDQSWIVYKTQCKDCASDSAKSNTVGKC